MQHDCVMSNNFAFGGINTSLIMAPGVPVNAARLRFFLTCEFTPQEITHALDVTHEVITR